MRVLRHHDIVNILQSLSRDECHALLTSLSDTLSALSATTSNDSATPSVIHQPVRESIVTSLGHTSLFMPASNTANVGIKTITLPSGGAVPSASTCIFSATGELLGLLNAEELTAFRTALASMIIFTRRQWGGQEGGEESGNLVIFGAGKQAKWHLRLALLLGASEGAIGRVTVVNRSRASLEAFERDVFSSLRKQYPTVQFSTLAQDAVAKTDPAEYENQLRATLKDNCVAIFFCTPSTEPLFPAEYLTRDPRRDGKRYISLIGSYKPHMQEIDTATLASAQLICVDSKEACLKQAGELIIGGITAEQLAEVGTLLTDFTSGKMKQQEENLVRTGGVVFKAVGLGIMDIVISKDVLDIAAQRGIGTVIEDF